MSEEIEYLREHLKEICQYKGLQEELTYDVPLEILKRICIALDYLQQENQHLLDLQKSMDKQYAELENNWNELKKWLIKEHDDFFNRLPDYAIAIENLADKMQEIERSK